MKPTYITSMNSVIRLSLIARVLAALAFFSLCGCSGEAPVAAAQAMKNSGDAPNEQTHEGDAHEDGGESGAGQRVKLTSEQIDNAGIGLAQAAPALVRERLPLFGVIAPNAERVREVTARFPGVIRSVGKRVGDEVQRGETLATVESNESLQSYAVVAPLNGLVTARQVNEGEYAGDKPMFTVADLSTVWVEVAVFPRDIGKVRVGQRVLIKNADLGLRSEGEFVHISTMGSRSSQTLTARVLLDNAARSWPPGLHVSAEATLASVTAPCTVLNAAVQTVENRTVVFVRNAEGFEPRPVELGRSDGEIVEVLAGVEAGEQYATKNSFVLKAELGKGEAEHGH